MSHLPLFILILISSICNIYLLLLPIVLFCIPDLFSSVCSSVVGQMKECESESNGSGTVVMDGGVMRGR